MGPHQCLQGRCGRCPPGSGVMSDFFIFFYFFLHTDSILPRLDQTLFLRTRLPPHAGDPPVVHVCMTGPHPRCSAASHLWFLWACASISRMLIFDWRESELQRVLQLHVSVVGGGGGQHRCDRISGHTWSRRHPPLSCTPESACVSGFPSEDCSGCWLQFSRSLSGTTPYNQQNGSGA